MVRPGLPSFSPREPTTSLRCSQPDRLATGVLPPSCFRIHGERDPTFHESVRSCSSRWRRDIERVVTAINQLRHRGELMDKTNIANLPREARVTETVTVGIAGMTCDHCVKKVESALQGLPGVKEVKVDRTTAVARITYDESVINVPAMHDAL